MQKYASTEIKKTVTILVADDSIVFRRFLRDMFIDSQDIAIVGEARNGIEALDIILKVHPDVILMDMEMPIMDGMTALQHLMIHCPTPTIMLSSLTSGGTIRSFDALKSGAIDFLSKDLLFEKNDQDLFRKVLTRKILSASRIQVHSTEPVFEFTSDEPEQIPESMIVFCEECGARNVIDPDAIDSGVLSCSECGDNLEFVDIQRYRRNTFVTILAGGEDCFRSLLNVIPRLDADMGGSIITVIKGNESHLETFTDYLNSISSLKVIRVREGMSLESGYCYVSSPRDNICLRPLSAHYTLQKITLPDDGQNSVDLLIASISAVFKEKCAAVLLSGNGTDGVGGMENLAGGAGIILALHPSKCLSPEAVRHAIAECGAVEVVENEEELIERIRQLHYRAKAGRSAA
jgi:two-component system chemotaxis response regulator CheB